MSDGNYEKEELKAEIKRLEAEADVLVERINDRDRKILENLIREEAKLEKLKKQLAGRRVDKNEAI